MRRRAFIGTLAATAFPFATRAQQPARLRRIGMLLGIVEHDPEAQLRVGAMLDELRGLAGRRQISTSSIAGRATTPSLCAPMRQSSSRLRRT